MKDGPSDLPGLTRDWITIWQSEMNAAASDTERLQAWRDWVTLCAGVASAAACPPAAPADAPAGPATRQPPARPSPAAAAPDERDATIERLARRVAALERLAGSEPGDG